MHMLMTELLPVLTKTIEEINVELNENWSLVSTWMSQNQLCLNADKTHLMVGGTSQRLRKHNISEDLNIVMEGFKLTESEEKVDQGDLQDLQVLQNRAAQHALRLPQRSNRRMMYYKLDLAICQATSFLPHRYSSI